jgi:hypothetical protein
LHAENIFTENSRVQPGEAPRFPYTKKRRLILLRKSAGTAKQAGFLLLLMQTYDEEVLFRFLFPSQSGFHLISPENPLALPH